MWHLTHYEPSGWGFTQKLLAISLINNKQNSLMYINYTIRHYSTANNIIQCAFPNKIKYYLIFQLYIRNYQMPRNNYHIVAVVPWRQERWFVFLQWWIFPKQYYIINITSTHYTFHFAPK